jgi:Chemotaxis phosphatase CheX
MNTELIIALNLAILLLAGVIVAIGTYRHEIKYRQRLKSLAQNLKEKLEEAQQRNRELEQELSKAGVAASPSVIETNSDCDTGLSHAVTSLKKQLQVRDKKIALLEDFKNKRTDIPEADAELLNDVIEGLKQELELSRDQIEVLEREVADTRILRSRVSVLSQEEDRHRSMANKMRDKLKDASNRLSDMMHLSKKAENLQRDNVKLDARVTELSGKTANLTVERDKLSAMLNEVSNKERFQRKRITQLERALDQVHSDQVKVEQRNAEPPETDAGSDAELVAKIEALESELEEVRGELERTLKEKAMIETHMVAMDNAATTLEQKEEEFERLKKEHETLELHFLMEDDENKGSSIVDTRELPAAQQGFAMELEDTLLDDGNEPPVLMTVADEESVVVHKDADPRKIKNSEAYASPLFLSVSEFWAKFIDANDEVVILSTSVPHKPSRLCMWTYVSIGNEELGIILGLDYDLSRRVSSALFDKAESELAEEDVADSIGEMTNIVAGFVANNLGDRRVLSAPKLVSRDEIDQLSFYMKTSAEILVGTQHGRLYLGTIKKSV